MNKLNAYRVWDAETQTRNQAREVEGFDCPHAAHQWAIKENRLQAHGAQSIVLVEDDTGQITKCGTISYEGFTIHAYEIISVNAEESSRLGIVSRVTRGA